MCWAKKEERMKRHQYAISIAVGVFIGAMVALMIGNTTTAILGGIVSAGFTAWIASLQWSGARKFATDVADKLDVKDMVYGIGRTIPATGKAVKWFLLAIKRLAIALATDVNARKTVLAGLLVITVSAMTVYVIYTVFLFNAAVLSSPPSDIWEFIIGTILILEVMLILATAIFLLASIAILWVNAIRVGPITPNQLKEYMAYKNYHFMQRKYFLFDWFLQLIEDDRGALISIVWMFYIRTGNTLKILAYPFILAIWGVVALANNKTGASALAAMILSGVHLSIAYIAGGGINMANANFWLSLVVAMGLGVAIGRKVSAMREPATHRPLPSIKLRDQVEFHRS